MRRVLILMPLIPLVLSGCGGVKKTLGMERNVPDEFAVVERAPLTMPPNFGLVPPQPGASAHNGQAPSAQAKELIVGNSATTSTSASAGEKALISNMGGRVDPSIRSKLGDDEPEDAKTVSQRLGLSTPALGKALDPVEEAQRLKKDDKPASQVKPVKK